MRLRDLVGEIGAKYDRQLPASSEAQMLLRQASVEFEQWLPAGYRVEGGKGKPTVTPKIAVFAASETAGSGIYLAYLFAADMSTVTLSLNQGVTEIAKDLGRTGARRTLAWEAAEIRATLSSHNIADLDTAMDLRSTAAPAVDHQRANILARTYRLDALPNERTMVADLRRFITLYALALEAKGRGGQVGDGAGAPPAQAAGPAKRAEATKPADAKKLAGTKKPVETKKPADTTRPAKTKRSGKRPSKRGEGRRGLLGRAVDQTTTMTRRGLLVALTAVPAAALVAPAALGLEHAPEPDKPPLSHAPTSRFTIDVSQHDWNRRGGNLDWEAVRDSGIAGMVARATYGDPIGFNYPTYHFADFARGAKAAGMPLRGGYHNLVRGDQASINRQVDWLRRELDAHDANWALLDIERYDELVAAKLCPRWDDVRRFDDRWAALDGRVLVGYLPPWNWKSHLGRPDLRAFRGPLVSSDYPLNKTADEYKRLYSRCGGDKGRGWTSYGNRVSEGWQFSSRAKVPGAAAYCGISAWRMTFDELYSLLVETPERHPAK